MLRQPGSGYLSTGLQQVVDRPFGLSEWIHRLPVALQRRRPGDRGRLRHGAARVGRVLRVPVAGRAARFDDTAGGFPGASGTRTRRRRSASTPSLARMIYRGDVKQGPADFRAPVSPGELAEGKFNFSDKVKQRAT